MPRNSLISFIVPVYNVEMYIKKCVESIINQDYKNIEIILIDDGSTDKSSKIIDELSKKDKRIITIHKPNGGVSSARNIGLDRAKGEYILFVDGDDFIDSDYASYFVNLINTDTFDIAYSSKCYDLNNKTRSETDNYKVYNSDDAIEGIYLGKFGVAVWNKIYKREFLNKNKIRFDENIWYGEGMLFNIVCLKNTDRIIVGDRLVYHQVFNPQSAMRKFNMESNLCGIRSLDIQKSILSTNNKKIINAWIYHKRCFNMSILVGILKSDTKKIYKKEYYKCIANLHKNIFVPLKVNVGVKTKILYMLAAIDPVLMAKIRIRNERKKLLNYK